MPTPINHKTVRRRRAGAFTLVEVMICAVLLALGFIALVAAFGHDTVVAQRAEDTTIGTFLADEIRDMAFQMTFADVLNLNGVVYSPARLSTGSTEDLANWSQRVTVTPVSATDLNQTVAAQGATAARINVEVRLRNTLVLTQTYYKFDMQGVPFTDAGG
jgi:type II secretory pathway pseudopilin PulG